MKLHKPTLKTSAIIDTKHTLLGPFSIWVDNKLQKPSICYPLPYRTASKYNVYLNKKIPSPRKKFTEDTVSMCPTIDTNKCVLTTESLSEKKNEST